jgi:hypothetical protein
MVDGVRYAVLAAVLPLAAPALAAAWNEIEGTANADHIHGTAATDRIRGLEGNDVLRGEDLVVVDFSRYAEQFGDGCEAVILDVVPEHTPDAGVGGTAFRS